MRYNFRLAAQMTRPSRVPLATLTVTEEQMSPPPGSPWATSSGWQVPSPADQKYRVAQSSTALPPSPLIYGHNQGALASAKNPVFGRRLRHPRLEEHAVREHIKHKEVQVVYVSTDQMVADPFTKALPKPLLEQHMLALGVCSLPAWLD